ncbi:cuticle protein 19-like [Anticarsia gemmatalis]|uniref:cuticle protein 19-like n=1 Tax=Anticarsia gemmatalis TaxID=129554 RepID=UPI003F771572
MYAKIFLVVVVLAAVSAMPQHGHKHEHHHEPAYSSQKLIQHHGHAEKILVDGHAKYEFAYEVKDPHTHDIKRHHESRHGDVVKGEYSLHQPDGTIRVVEYSSDKKTGFNANVHQKGHAKHIVPEHHHHH